MQPLQYVPYNQRIASARRFSEIKIAGGIKTNGAGVAPIEQHGSIEKVRVSSGFVAARGGFDTI